MMVVMICVSHHNLSETEGEYVFGVLLTSPFLSEQRRYCLARHLSCCHAVRVGCVCVCVSAALVSTAKVMCCIHCSLVVYFISFTMQYNLLLANGRDVLKLGR